jgi:hypothetical protein
VELGTYDTMQVCMHGHRINPRHRGAPQFNRVCCPDCGEKTITTCPECKVPIKGIYTPPGLVTLPPPPPPVKPFCDSCGMAYPWHVAAVANALEVLRVEGVPGADVEEIERNLRDITRDTPRTEAAALRVRKVLNKAGKPLYDVAVRALGEIAAGTAKSYLGL